MEWVRMETAMTRAKRVRAREQGFSLVEVLVAMGILATGLLSLAAVFTMSVKRVSESTPMLIAREKAREAIESVHAARDTAELAWNTVLNDSSPGGVFKTGEQPLKTPGNDGLVNTGDDGPIETMRKPGNDGLLNTADDQIVTLTNFTREIAITPMNYDGTAIVNPNLRQVTVTVKYKIESVWRTYTLVSYVSSYS